VLPKNVARPLKRVSLTLGQIAIIPIGLFLSYELIEYLGRIQDYLVVVALIGGPILTIVCFVLVLRRTRGWKFAYDVEGWWIEREERLKHPKRAKWKRRARRILIWVPCGIAAFVLFFFPVATHIAFWGAGHLKHYRVSIPITWAIMPVPGADERGMTAYVNSKGVGKFGFVPLGWAPGYTAVLGLWCPWEGTSLQVAREYEEARAKKSTKASRRGVSLGRTTLTCWETEGSDFWAASHVLRPGYWRVQCYTPSQETERALSVTFYGSTEDIPALYEVIRKIKQVD